MYSTIKDFYNVNRDEEHFQYNENSTIKEDYNDIKINNYCNSITDLIGLNNKISSNNNCINLTYKQVMNENIANPKVWGPSFWFSLHNGSLSYPIKPNKIVSERMRGFILGIPYMLPCKSCSEHAIMFIEQNYSNLDTICSSRTYLFEFFVRFHNFVNKRLNKPEMSISDAKSMYTTCVNVLSY